MASHTSQFEGVSAGPTRVGTAISRLVKIMRRSDMKRRHGALIAAFALTIAAKALAVTAPVLFGAGVDAIARANGGASLSPVIWLMVGYVVARFVAASLQHGREVLFVPITQDVNRAVAVQAYAHAQRLSLQFHLSRRAGALQLIIERGGQATEALLRFLAFNMLPTFVEFVFAAAILWLQFGFWFTVIVIGTVVAYAVFTSIVTEWRIRQRRMLNEADGERRARAVDSLANFETVKIFSGEQRETERFDQSARHYGDIATHAARGLASLSIGQEFLLGVGLLAVVLLASIGAARGEMALGDAAAVTLIMMNIYGPLGQLGLVWREIKQRVVDLEKLFGLLDVKTGVEDAREAKRLTAGGGAVRFERVTFVHDGRATGLSDVSFEAPPGAFVGICGTTGAGKSTILKLLFRLYDPIEGRILIDDQDIGDLEQASLRDALGMVPQEVSLFNETLRYNIGYGAPQADEFAIQQALGIAQLTEFVSRLPEGLETRVGERGLKLSGGEKQRVGIARAILRNPKVLLLDEATSSLDSGTELEVQVALREAARGRTTIAIAHRLSTITHADLILVLEKGRIVERGAHAELVSRGGVYAQMWSQQRRASEKYAVEGPEIVSQG